MPRRLTPRRSPVRFSAARPEPGGLGHLGIQFARKLGYRVAALGRGSGNAALARQLGADVYIDSAATDAASELQKLGGARVILATAPSGKAMSALVGGLGPNGSLVVVGATEDAIEVAPIKRCRLSSGHQFTRERFSRGRALRRVERPHLPPTGSASSGGRRSRGRAGRRSRPAPRLPQDALGCH